MTETKTISAGDERLYWIHAVSPLHVGAGRGIGFIDLPIMREKVTNWPLVPGSAVKGVLADHFGVTEDSRKDNSLHRLAFGRAGDDSANSGSLVFTDARLVCLPVRSLYGTFAWCTSPLALERLKRDLKGKAAELRLPAIPGAQGNTLPILVPSDPPSAVADQKRVFFEDLDFDALPSADLAPWAAQLAKFVFPDGPWRKLFAERLAVVGDDVFNFLCDTATQVDARVKIDDDTKTVAEGQLWYEESLPTETILAGIVWCGPVFGQGNRRDAGKRNELLSEFVTQSCDLQIGGKATVGRGQVQLSFGPGTAEAKEMRP